MIRIMNNSKSQYVNAAKSLIAAVDEDDTGKTTLCYRNEYWNLKSIYWFIIPTFSNISTFILIVQQVFLVSELYI